MGKHLQGVQPSEAECELDESATLCANVISCLVSIHSKVGSTFESQDVPMFDFDVTAAARSPDRLKRM